ncbi:M50 family metallopeptidase [Bacillus taeanensis]|uniref:Stage IV sporulation protein FB n=1 Tax=Bacillus taeanensis TaxID=273032 RepID=A0A366XYX0_9BACI|nr:M50 family metallopeptidase [Bacillus taeanensis]RBW71600.1 stage IV sporulation protein FB [Bacillus taeanensis]
MINKFVIHPLFWAVFSISMITGHFRDFILVFCLIFIHEIGHTGAAYFFGWRIKKIVFLPFGGVAEVDEHGNKPFREEFIVVMAGPCQHIWMTGAAYFLMTFNIWDPAFYEQFLTYNFMILFFNLLPIWPLDGGKLLFLACARRYPFKRAHLVSLVISLHFLIVFAMVCFIFYPFQLNVFIIILFLGAAHYREWRHHPYIYLRFLLERYHAQKRDCEKQLFIEVQETAFLQDVLKTFRKGVSHRIILKQGMKPRHPIINEYDLLHLFFKEQKAWSTVAECFHSK